MVKEYVLRSVNKDPSKAMPLVHRNICGRCIAGPDIIIQSYAPVAVAAPGRSRRHISYNP